MVLSLTEIKYTSINELLNQFNDLSVFNKIISDVENKLDAKLRSE